MSSPQRTRRAFSPGNDSSGAAAPLEPRLLMAVDVLTWHNNNARDGANLNETTLTPANVNASTFGRIGQVDVDGVIFGQPLIKTGVTLPDGTTHDVVYVVTEHDSVYAFDANNLSLLWHDNFTDPAHGIMPITSDDVGSKAVGNEVGITSTPVIDPSTNTLFVEHSVRIATPGQPVRFAQFLDPIDLATGAIKPGGPVPIAAAVPGRGAGSKNGIVSFNPLRQLQRSALLLSGGVVYIAFASFDDIDPYHGWLLGYDAHTYKQVAAFNNTPNGAEGGIWMAGAGPSADAQGNIYLASGNGTFTPRSAYGDTLVKLRRDKNGLKVVDSFTPFNQASMARVDADFGSGGVVLLPDQPGTNPHLAITGDKGGNLYLVNRDKLGGYNPRFNKIVQTVKGLAAGIFETPAYFNGNIYFSGPSKGDQLKQYPLILGYINTKAKVGPMTYHYPGATPSVSANGKTNGIVWAIDNASPAALRAYDANDVSNLLYASDNAINAARDTAGPGSKFVPPTVANGKVYVAGHKTLNLFGLLPSNPGT